jgi:hypothetical protein
MMRAISLWQPWASLLIANPRIKIYETRSWETMCRGPVIIHAAKKNDREIAEIMLSMQGLFAKFGINPLSLPFGSLIGVVDLTACRRMTETNVRSVTDLERQCGDWAEGRFAWRCDNPVAFDKPIPFRGAQGFFNVPQSILPMDLIRARKAVA